MNEVNTGQFERTLLVADENTYAGYLEGCTAPQRDQNQLHAAVVELIFMDGADNVPITDSIRMIIMHSFNRKRWMKQKDHSRPN